MNLFAKDASFYFDDGCLKAWEKLKQELVFTSIISAPYFAIGAVLGQCIDNRKHVIYYASRTLNDIQINYYDRKEIFSRGIRVRKVLTIPTRVQNNYVHRPLCA